MCVKLEMLILHKCSCKVPAVFQMMLWSPSSDSRQWEVQSGQQSVHLCLQQGCTAETCRAGGTPAPQNQVDPAYSVWIQALSAFYDPPSSCLCSHSTWRREIFWVWASSASSSPGRGRCCGAGGSASSQRSSRSLRVCRRRAAAPRGRSWCGSAGWTAWWTTCCSHSSGTCRPPLCQRGLADAAAGTRSPWTPCCTGHTSGWACAAPSCASDTRSRSSQWSCSPPPCRGILCAPSHDASVCWGRWISSGTRHRCTGRGAAGCAAHTCGTWAACSSWTPGRSPRVCTRTSSAPGCGRGWRVWPGSCWWWRPPGSRPRCTGRASRRCGWGRVEPSGSCCRTTSRSHRGHMCTASARCVYTSARPVSTVCYKPPGSSETSRCNVCAAPFSFLRHGRKKRL